MAKGEVFIDTVAVAWQSVCSEETLNMAPSYRVADTYQIFSTGHDVELQAQTGCIRIWKAVAF